LKIIEIDTNDLRIYSWDNEYQFSVFDTTIHLVACGVPEEGTTFDVAEVHKHGMVERLQRTEAYASLAAATYHPLDC